ncbi:hypothetical protein HQ393_01915 [Chitinibacter bivalviorum]|uniref:Uncharacterized protein n=1 Tax=Chitinibacter bivalviorum TaxID=2739434 RepID=A0A7H9BEP1_9NEIS|nr:hypothetical protein [Chitinibacter bivalviorum]QLG87099.1 hypothetical protein HQ393_01915 [Chitinibacter bivalviorum]
MNIERAQQIYRDWNSPLLRQFFWYLIIPATVEVQRHDPVHFNYGPPNRLPFRYRYLFQLLATMAMLVGLASLNPMLAWQGMWALKLYLIYASVVNGVWVLAYWSMKMPRSVAPKERG